MPQGIVEAYSIDGGREREWTHPAGGYVVSLGQSVFSPYFAATGDPESPARLARVNIIDRVTCPVTFGCSSQARILGRERLRVPAGEFDALKVELRQDWTSGNSGARRQIGERVLVVWYAPEVKRALKFSNRETIRYGDPVTGDFDLELVAHEAGRDR